MRARRNDALASALTLELPVAGPYEKLFYKPVTHPWSKGVKKGILGGIVTVIVVVGSITAWHLIAARYAANQQHPMPPPIPVTPGEAATENVPVFVSGLGTVQDYMNVAVKTRVDGQITGVSFTEGQDVKAGDQLFQIDPRPFEAALAQAQANKRKDEAQLQAARLVLGRYAKLLASATQTQEAYDNQKATVGQLEGAVAADQAIIDTAQLNLDYTRIRSPIDGRTGARLVDPGNVVQASQNTPLVTVAQIKPIFVSFTVPQEFLDQIRQNQAKQQLDVIAYASDAKTRLSAGKLTLIDNTIDVATGTIHLKATFDNADEKLWPGEFVSARLVLSTRENAITVPAQTVMQGPQGAYVYIIRPDDSVERHNVQVAATQDGRAIIQEGLSGGDRVVVDGQYRLTDGAKIAAGTQQAADSAAGASR
jgi:membrane fusion protein, multidrug efflux system